MIALAINPKKLNNFFLSDSNETELYHPLCYAESKYKISFLLLPSIAELQTLKVSVAYFLLEQRNLNFEAPSRKNLTIDVAEYFRKCIRMLLATCSPHYYFQKNAIEFFTIDFVKCVAISSH